MSNLDPFDAVDLPDIDEAPAATPTAPRLEDDKEKFAVRFGILGAGQGGGRIASKFYEFGHRRVVVLNTTSADFRGTAVPPESRLVLKTVGEQATGAGKRPEVAAAAIESQNETVYDFIRDRLGSDVDRILLCVGGGGGTGTGTAATLIRIARQFMADNRKNPSAVGVIVSKPKSEEGQQVQTNFNNLISELRNLEAQKLISPVVVVDNGLISQRFPQTSVGQFWDVANKNLCGLFDIFNILSANDSQYISFDRADYESVLNAGNLVFGMAKIAQFTTTAELCDAIRSNVKKNLLSADLDLSTATHAAGIIVAMEEVLNDLPQEALDEAYRALNRVLGNNVTLHQGVYPGKKPGIYIYTLIAGLKAS